jgi:hypothetical protein
MISIGGNFSNVRTGTNPSYTLTDFLTQYPQFGQDSNGNYIVPQGILEMYLSLANACIKQVRWNAYWQQAMGWFMAHFCTLYLQGTANPNSGAAAVLKAGQTRGLETSVSVGDVSTSTDYSIITNGIDGWAAWKLTAYGTQLATIGRLVGKGNMYVW